MIKLQSIIENVRENCGIKIAKIQLIEGGVMNFTYLISNEDNEFILKVNPTGREFVSIKEKNAIKLCQQHNIKVPKLICEYTSTKKGENSYVILEKLKGKQMSYYYDGLSMTKKNTLLLDIIGNINNFNKIKFKESGETSDLLNFSNVNWYEFLQLEIQKSLYYLRNYKSTKWIEKINSFCNQSLEMICKTDCSFVWSDFDLSNIIITENGQLSGFIDFEGTLSGDVNYSIGCFLAKYGRTTIIESIFEETNVNNYLMDFYSVVRYLRLSRYSNFDLPTGKKRDKIDDFLPYASSLIKTITNGAE
jgi:fructosamine-3-kinase